MELACPKFWRLADADMEQCLDNRPMLESLRLWAAPYGGDAFLVLTVMAVLSYGALLHFKARLPVATLRRFIRLAALIALPFSVLAMEMPTPAGEGSHLGLAVLAIVWCVVVGITCKNEITRQQA